MHWQGPLMDTGRSELQTRGWRLGVGSFIGNKGETFPLRKRRIIAQPPQIFRPS